jgi:phosphate transport system substrate-binding protein
MPRHRLLLLAVLSLGCAGQTLPADPFTRTRLVIEELRQWDQSPDGKEMQKLARKFEELRREALRAEEQIRNDAYRQLEDKRRTLVVKLQEARDAETAAMAAAAAKIYSDRHAQIAARPVPPVPQGRALKFDLLTFPRLDGSTSTHPLAVIIASRLLDVSFEWQYPLPVTNVWRAQGPTDRMPFWEFDGLFFDPMLEVQLAASRVNARGDTETRRRTALMINHVLAKNSNTHDAYLNLLNGACDLLFVARAPSADESAAARQRNVEIDTVPIARDALVFLVHTSNPVRTLTRAQLSAIYRQEVDDWNQLGSRQGMLSTLWREPNSGSRELFDAFDILAGKPPRPDVRQLYALGMSGPYHALVGDPNAIAYTVYYYDQYMALSPYTRQLAIDGIQPGPETIASGKYPFVAPVLAAFRKSEPDSSPARRLVQWLVSPEGQAVVRQSGYIPAREP